MRKRFDLVLSGPQPPNDDSTAPQRLHRGISPICSELLALVTACFRIAQAVAARVVGRLQRYTARSARYDYWCARAAISVNIPFRRITSPTAALPLDLCAPGISFGEILRIQRCRTEPRAMYWAVHERMSMKHYPVHFLSRKLRSTLRVTVAILAVATVLLVTGPLMSAQTQPTFGGCFEMADTSGHRLTTDVEPNAIAAQGENALAFTGTHYGNVEQAMDYSYTTVPVTVYNSGVTNITGPGLGLDASGNTIYAVWAQNGTLWFNSGSATPGQEGYVWGAASYYYPSLSGVSYPPRVVLWGGNPWVVAVSNGIIYFSQIGGTTWYSTPFTAAGGASVTLFNNELWLAWTNPTTGHVNVAYTTNGIPTFGPAIDTGISVKGSIPQLFT